MPPVPEVSGPADGMVVEGNLGRFIAEGSNVDATSPRFSWKPGRFSGSAPASRQIRTHTTHYLLCVFQTGIGIDTERECDSRSPTNDATSGYFLFEAPCSESEVAPNHGAGLMPRQGGGYTPRYAGGDPHVIELGWKMRACNGDKCSDWSGSRGLTFLPPPRLREPRRPSGNPQGWPVTMIWDWIGPRAGDPGRRPETRLCISAPGIWCRTEVDPRTATRQAPSVWDAGSFGGTAGRGEQFDIGSASDGGVDGSGTPYWFAIPPTAPVNWTAATCWDRPTRELVCVYNDQVKSLTFPPR